MGLEERGKDGMGPEGRDGRGGKEKGEEGREGEGTSVPKVTPPL